MNDLAIQPGSTPALKLSVLSTETPDAAVCRVAPLPVPAHDPTTAPSVQAEQKDGFVASAALGGIIAALTMLLLVPTCFFLVNVAKQAFSGAPAVTQTQETKPAVTWPDVALSGIVAADPRRGGSAILNKELINLHQQILGVRVVSFHDQEVVLEYKGVQKTLRVGENTL